MPFHEPFRLGPFLVDNAGRLSLREPHYAPGFRFRWRERLFHALLGDGLVALSAVLGRVPSTAADPSGVRDRSFATLRGLQATLPPGWRLRLRPDHSVELLSEAVLVTPTTAPALLATVVGFVLALDPYLALLDEDGLAQVPPAVRAAA